MITYRPYLLPQIRSVESKKNNARSRLERRPVQNRTSAFLLLIFFACATAATLKASNWYVEPTAQGSNNGTSWSNAWAGDAINWSSVQPGDTVWLAGGSYGKINTISASGTASAPVTIMRVTSDDEVPVASPGWSASFDSQAVLAAGFNPINGDYIVIDGHEWAPPHLPTTYGILINNAASPTNSAMNIGLYMANASNITARNIEIAGPPSGSTGTGYNITQFETDGVALGDNCLVSGCKIHDMDTPVKTYASHSTIEYTTIYNVSSYIQVVYGNYPHPDSIYCGGGTDLTVRYCVMANIVSEGNFFDQGGETNMLFYGNLFFQGDTATNGCDAVEIKTQLSGANWGTFSFYNNTWVDWSKGAVLADQPAASAVSGSSVMQNNLFVNCNNSFDNLSFPFVLTQYNGYCNSQKSLGAADTHSITANTIPFVGPYIKGTAPATTQEAIPTGYDPTQYIPNFYLASNSWPIAAGSDLGAPYDIDMNGNSIGATLGAFAPSGAGAAPTAPPTTTPPASTDPTTTPPTTANPPPTPTTPHRRFRHH